VLKESFINETLFNIQFLQLVKQHYIF